MRALCANGAPAWLKSAATEIANAPVAATMCQCFRLRARNNKAGAPGRQPGMDGLLVHESAALKVEATLYYLFFFSSPEQNDPLVLCCVAVDSASSRDVCEYVTKACYCAVHVLRGLFFEDIFYVLNSELGLERAHGYVPKQRWVPAPYEPQITVHPSPAK